MVNFRLFGFPISVHFSFLIVVAFVLDIGLDGAELALFAAAAFLSILLHELGHAFTARSFGAEVKGIVLQTLGGVTYWQPRGLSAKGWPRFAIAAAGPGMQLLLGLGLWAVIDLGWLGGVLQDAMQHPIDGTVFGIGVVSSEYGLFFIGVFTLVSVVWALFNLLPVGGFDGSHMLRELLEMWFPQAAWLLALVIGLGTAGAAAWVLYNAGYDFAPVILLAFAGMDLLNVVQERSARKAGVS
jgi:Zn-dependent protease